ncbi:uncharacterized protein [Dendrobates tinctorius]|uniref:uncharacterized protein n=1 Tax=Dendrobates tinctorius TaxID=92724 RepID=UPI003CC94837
MVSIHRYTTHRGQLVIAYEQPGTHELIHAAVPGQRIRIAQNVTVADYWVAALLDHCYKDNVPSLPPSMEWDRKMREYYHTLPSTTFNCHFTAEKFGPILASIARKHEDYITYTNEDSPHGPENEQRDVLTGSEISVPGAPDVVINISPDEDEVTSSDREFDIFCTPGDITMPHKAGIVEVKESKINPNLNDYRQTPPSVLKGRNPMKNKSKGRHVSFQESDDRYVYIYDSESSQPGQQMRYFRNKQGFRKKKNPAGGHNSTTTPLHGGYHVRISQPVMKQNRHRFQDWCLHSPMDMTLTRVFAVRHVHGQVTHLLHNDVDSGIGLYSHPWM